jgi:predicted nuclease of restriction endonuclease-like (RecB) superfamily
MEQHFDKIIELIKHAKQKAFLAVNSELINLYWDVGKYISDKTSSDNWGKSVVASLSEFIKEKDPTIKGFSSQNLWRMKQFFETYSNSTKLSALTREITWTNNLIILSKSQTEIEREFYLKNNLILIS